MGGCMLERTLTHSEFGRVIGVSRQTVDELVRRGVLGPGATGREWVRAYCGHLQCEIDSRLGSLTASRAALELERREEVAMRNTIKRRQYAPVILLKGVLSLIGGRVAEIFSGLPASINAAWPDATAEQREMLRMEIERACDLARSLSTQALNEPDAAERD